MAMHIIIVGVILMGTRVPFPVDSFDNSTVKDVLWPFQAKMHQLQEASTFVFKSRLLEVKHRSWWKACRMPYNCC